MYSPAIYWLVLRLFKEFIKVGGENMKFSEVTKKQSSFVEYRDWRNRKTYAVNARMVRVWYARHCGTTLEFVTQFKNKSNNNW